MQLSAQFKSLGASMSPTAGSLIARSGLENSAVRDAALTPNSVLSAYEHFRNIYNGNSAADASRQTPSGQLPTQNGMSQSTYQARYPGNFGTRLNVI